MKKFNKEKERGFVGIIILIIIGLAAIKYFFDWSIFDALKTEEGRATLAYVKQLIATLKGVVVDLWNYIRA